jgi:hypothetical protein
VTAVAGCVSGGELEVRIDGMMADVTPYDIDTGDEVCTADPASRFVHEGAIRFSETGTAQVILRARAFRQGPVIEFTKTVQIVEPVVCDAIGIPIMRVSVRDQFGQPAAIGATVVIENLTTRASGEGYGDSLRIWTDDPYGRTGTYRVEVSRPYHRTTVIPAVRVSGGPCGVERPHEIDVSIELLPGSPPIRQVVLPPWSFGYGGAGQTTALRAFVVRDPDASPDVTWASTDTTAVVIDERGVMTSVCRPTRGHAWISAASVVDPTVRDSVSVTVFQDLSPRCFQ